MLSSTDLIILGITTILLSVVLLDLEVHRSQWQALL